MHPAVLDRTGGPRVGIPTFDPDDWNDDTRTPGSPTDIGADASRSSSSRSANVAAASACPAINLANAAVATVTATPSLTVATSSKTAKPAVILDESQTVPGIAVAGRCR